MNKKLNWLMILPIYGTLIWLLYVFVKAMGNQTTIGDQTKIKKIFLFVWGCGLAGASCVVFLLLIQIFIAYFINMDIAEYLMRYGVFVSLIVGGYLMNLVTFLLIKKHYKDLM